MTDKNYKIIEFYYNAKPNYKSFWGVISYENKYYCCFGRNHTVIQFTCKNDKFSVNSLKHRQVAKGFKPMDAEHYQEIRPDFLEDLEAAFTAFLLTQDYN